MKTSLNIKFSETIGSKIIKSRSITDINPNATSQQITNFTKGLLRLTTNVYGETNRIQTINVDTEEIPSTQTPKTTATLTAPSTFNQASGTITVDWTSDYTGNIFVTSDDNDATFAFEATKSFYATGLSNGSTVTIMIPETENYTSATATINIVR